MATHDSKLLGKTQIAQGTMEFLLERPEGFDYRAGQFGDIVLPSPPDTPKQESTHCFSYVSAPYEDRLRMATRMRDTPFKNAIGEVADGVDIQLNGPFGDFTLHKNESVPAVFVIGGIGITPIHSMIAQATHDRTGHRLTLIHANRTPELAPYAEALEQLAEQNPNFTLVSVYTDRDGHVNEATIKQHVEDIAASKYYLSGPEGMVKAMRALLLKVGADEDNIRTEEFEGY